MISFIMPHPRQDIFNFISQQKHIKLSQQMRKNIFPLFHLFFLASLISSRWTEQQAKQWYQKYEWSAGVNFTPAYAVNEIELWQNFDLDKIYQELTWGVSIGFTKYRVFLHIYPYIKDKQQFLNKIYQFLAIAKGRGAHIIFVLFDDCWNSHYVEGKQPQPIPGVHNSQWVQCPGSNPISEQILENYVTDIMTKFKDSETMIMWDLYNQIGNSNKFIKSLPFAKKVFQWARKVNPSQPITSGHWSSGIEFEAINNYILSQSDIISFHAYCDVECTRNNIKEMKKHNRPVICTQYMARPRNSKFITHLPVFKEENVWAINWGFVFGRIQTYYPWGSKQGSPIPEVWFHDVLHPDGTPFDQNQTDFIRQITRVQNTQ